MSVYMGVSWSAVSVVFRTVTPFLSILSVYGWDSGLYKIGLRRGRCGIGERGQVCVHQIYN